MRTAACGLTGTLDTGTSDAESTCFTLSHSMCGMYLISSRLFPNSGNTGFISRISLAFWDPCADFHHRIFAYFHHRRGLYVHVILSDTRFGVGLGPLAELLLTLGEVLDMLRAPQVRPDA